MRKLFRCGFFVSLLAQPIPSMTMFANSLPSFFLVFYLCEINWQASHRMGSRLEEEKVGSRTDMRQHPELAALGLYMKIIQIASLALSQPNHL